MAEELGCQVLVEDRIGTAIQVFFAEDEKRWFRMDATFFRGQLRADTGRAPEYEMEWVESEVACRGLFHECHAWAVRGGHRMPENRSAPSATVVPILVYSDVGKAIAWLCKAFGFGERLRAERDGVVGHAQLVVGDGAIMLGREGGPFHSARDQRVSAYVHVTVHDVDRHCRTAKEHGAKVIVPPSDMPFGERQYTVEDYEGHWWTFSQHIADVTPEEWGATVAEGQ